MNIQELLAFEAIRITLYRYARAVDRGAVDAVLATFAADALFEPIEGWPACRGHAAIRDFFDVLGAKFRQLQTADAPPFALRHHLTTSCINPLGTLEAEGFTRFLAMSPDGLDHSGFYKDRFVADTHDRWLIAQRRIVIDYVSPHSRLPSIQRASAPDAAP